VEGLDLETTQEDGHYAMPSQVPRQLLTAILACKWVIEFMLYAVVSTTALGII
jgi:hypothetical protein